MKKFFTHRIVLFLTALVLVAAAAFPSVYFYRKYTTLASDLQAASQEDPKALVARVAKHILLPSGEEPTVMTVTDKEKLSGQVFFANAKNGDKVLVYEKAKKAFLYDPVADRVIEVGPIVLAATGSATLSGGGPTPGTMATPSASLPAPRSYTFAVLNATLTKGLAETYAAKLILQVPGAQVVARGNAKGDYPTSLLVDVEGTHKAEASALAQTLGLEVSPFPAGEATTAADFLIILGADQK